jgi:hypothetical protein
VSRGAEDQDRKDGAKGFAGLSSLVSDVDATVSEVGRNAGATPHAADREAARATMSKTSSASAEPSPAYQPPPQSSRGEPTGKWIAGIAVVIGLIWLASLSDKKRSDPNPAYSSPSESQSTTAPPAWQPPSRPTEDQPPVGRGRVLGVAQIRYCLAEDIRLKAAKAVVNGFLESDVDRFNSMVADYNNRCVEFKYRKGSLESAKNDISSFYSELQVEGVSRFPTNGNSGTPSVAKSKSNYETKKYLDSESLAVDDKNKLMEILSTNVSNCTTNAECEIGLFSLRPVDIDHDGNYEYLVTHRDYCGSGGCSTFLFKKSKSTGWHQVASAFGEVTIGNKQVNGYQTLIVGGKVYRSAGGWDMKSHVYSWTGNGYQLSRNAP